MMTDLQEEAYKESCTGIPSRIHATDHGQWIILPISPGQEKAEAEAVLPIEQSDPVRAASLGLLQLFGTENVGVTQTAEV